MNDLSLQPPHPHHGPSLRPPPRRRPSEPPHAMDTSMGYRPQGYSPTSPAYPASSYSPSSTLPHSHQMSSGFSIEPHSSSSNGPTSPSSATTAPGGGGGGSTSFSRTTDYDDPRKRRLETLATMDNAEFGWFHVRACMVAGVGFFTDAYDLFAISLVSPMLGYVYYQDNHNTVPDYIDLGIKISASLGTFFGQIGFGYLADKLGRKRVSWLDVSPDQQQHIVHHARLKALLTKKKKNHPSGK